MSPEDPAATPGPPRRRPPIALTIAGSDPSGGAGLQADLKTFHQHRCYGQSVVTLLTVQSTLGVSAVEVMSPELVGAQLDAVLADAPPAAGKTGALGSAAVIEAVALRAARFGFPLVVDPVMVSKHGATLLDPGAARTLVARLLPHAALVTPNTPEAEAIVGREVRSVSAVREAARAIADLGPAAVLVKGGHLDGDPVDVLLVDGALHELRAARVETRHTHGTGCTYAAAIAARLAHGEGMLEAVRGAHAYLLRALQGAPGIGRGIGPVDHFAEIEALERGG